MSLGLPQVKLAPSMPKVALGPRPVAIFSPGDLLFIELDRHFSIGKSPAAGFQDRLTMNVSQSLDLLAYPVDYVVNDSRCPRFAPRAWNTLFIEMS